MEFKEPDAPNGVIFENIVNLYECKYRFDYEGDIHTILLWKYWKNSEAFEKKFKEFFNFGDDVDTQTENFIRIYLENDENAYED